MADIHRAPSAVTILKKRPASHGGAADECYFRKTARGKLQRVVREHYLRPASDFPSPPKLADGLAWVMPDTNAVLHQFDLIASPAFPAPLLVAQTVLDEVRHRSLPLYNKLRTLVDDDFETPGGTGKMKRGWTVWNEAIEETFLERKDGENPNDRNDRAIRHLASYYSAILSSGSSTGPSAKRQKTSSSSRPALSANEIGSAPLILLTDDAANLSLALSDGLVAVTAKDYVTSLPASQQESLVDLLAVSGSGLDRDAAGAGRRKGAALYAEHLPTSVLQAGVKAGKFVQGHFNPSQYNFREATVNATSLPRPVLLAGLESMNRAVAGDLVVVEVLPQSEWKSIGEEVVDEDAKGNDPDADSVAESGDSTTAPTEGSLHRPSAPMTKQREVQPTGRVVGILKRAFRPYVCTLDRASLPPSALTSSASVTVLASPVQRTLPRIRLLTRQAAHLASQKFLVSIDRWPITSRYPEGHFVRVLGQVGSKEGEVESLLEEWEVPYRPFSSAILSCLPEEGDKWIVPPKGEADVKNVWRGREDLRDEIICSIDPPGCQDIDDALHAKRLPNGNIQAGVHIADVSHFVHPDNPMDAEAASRGTTVYLVDKRIDMLPSLLGTNLCSLRPYVERLAFSVIWELDDDADIVDVRFTKSVIASKEAFTYEAAQRRKDDKSLNDPLTEGIRLLNSIAIKLKAKRMTAGALNLASPEVKIYLEQSEQSGPVDVEHKELFETNSLVEEFMLLANISVAERIYKQFPQTAVLRRHAPPPKTNFEVLQDVLQKRRGMTLDVSTSGALADSLDKCVDPSFPSFNTLVRIMATRCMLSAEYFCSGSLPASQFSHYGLASPIYTHFTSPIRRYADVLVHRQLSAAISGLPLHTGLQTRAWVDKTLEVVNKRHRGAQGAARASIEFYVALAIQRRKEDAQKKAGVGKEGSKVRAEAFVIRAFRNGLAVFVSQFGLEGLVTFRRDNDYDADSYEIHVPTPSGKNVTIGVFDKVEVEISVEKDKNTQRGKVVMHLVEPVDSRGM
ncbi:mitotic control protein dis3 [Rhodotorula toruloides]|uniref:Ribosomal RNA-processing protein 44 n=1 Tax=Rhodotorula toruloides TaxID=5286 RepID=A0A511KPU5_RHOTO|nr:mitotic control protein dis3 [Rhodotorula toruloides]